MIEQPDKTEESIRHWHLDKRLNIAHIFSTIAMIVTAVLYISKMEARIVLLEQQVHHQREYIEVLAENQERSVAQGFAAIQQGLVRVEGRLDRIEKRTEKLVDDFARSQ